jgi:hypothetical protein
MARIAAVPGKGVFMNPDASLLVQGISAGGSTVVNFATAMPPPLPDNLVGPMARMIMQAAQKLGLEWRKLDKMIRPPFCRSGCWRCGYGCLFGAKWTARDFLDDAVRDGASLVDRARVRRIIVEDGRATGVEFVCDGARQAVAGRIVVLAGGGFGSPRLLHASGLHPGSSPFFSDPSAWAPIWRNGMAFGIRQKVLRFSALLWANLCRINNQLSLRSSSFAWMLKSRPGMPPFLPSMRRRPRAAANRKTANGGTAHPTARDRQSVPCCRRRSWWRRY